MYNSTINKTCITSLISGNDALLFDAFIATSIMLILDFNATIISGGILYKICDRRLICGDGDFLVDFCNQLPFLSTGQTSNIKFRTFEGCPKIFVL